MRAIWVGMGILAGCCGFTNGARAQSADTLQAYFDTWFDRVQAAQDSQPHWMTPLVTVTPRLEEEFRADAFFEALGNGADLTSIGNGKGLELIPDETQEVILSAPTYEWRSSPKQATGYGDWPVLLFKQRLFSGNEDHGNYIVTAFLGLQVPIGDHTYTNHSVVITPTIAAGKGWGDFDIQATEGVAIPTGSEPKIGISFLTNVAFQYHLFNYFWPEFEVNSTAWSNGERAGKNQVFLTPGIIFGRFPVAGRTRAIFGFGYQSAVTPNLKLEPLTPAYNHNWVLTARLTF